MQITKDESFQISPSPERKQTISMKKEKRASVILREKMMMMQKEQEEDSNKRGVFTLPTVSCFHRSTRL